MTATVAPLPPSQRSTRLLSALTGALLAHLLVLYLITHLQPPALKPFIKTPPLHIKMVQLATAPVIKPPVPPEETIAPVQKTVPTPAPQAAKPKATEPPAKSKTPVEPPKPIIKNPLPPKPVTLPKVAIPTTPAPNITQPKQPDIIHTQTPAKTPTVAVPKPEPVPEAPVVTEPLEPQPVPKPEEHAKAKPQAPVIPSTQDNRLPEPVPTSKKLFNNTKTNVTADSSTSILTQPDNTSTVHSLTNASTTSKSSSKNDFTDSGTTAKPSTDNGSGGAPAKGPKTVSNVGYKVKPELVYPDAAKDTGDKGTVIVKVLIDSTGKVTKATVDKSSGSGILDKAALEIAQKTVFFPYEENGVAQAIYTTMPLEFHLN